MRKRGMKILIGIVAVVALFVGIKFLYQHFITDRIMDGGTGMENPAGPMLDYLSADWEEACGWRVTIDGYQMEIFFSDEKIYQGSFSFSYSPGEDVNKKMQMYPDQNSFDSENGDFSGVIKELYTEDGMMYLDIKFDKYKQENGTRRQVILNRVEYGKPAESESEEIQEVSEMAELVEFSWHQSAMNYDGCFDFRITSSEQESAAPRLYCDYTDPETGERIEVGEECSGFQGSGLDGTRTDSAACPPVPLERWEELADFLHTAELSPYHSPEPGLMDATDSKIQVTWREDGEKFTNSYSGIYAHELLKLLQDIAGEVSRGALKEPKPE